MQVNTTIVLTWFDLMKLGSGTSSPEDYLLYHDTSAFQPSWTRYWYLLKLWYNVIPQWPVSWNQGVVYPSLSHNSVWQRRKKNIEKLSESIIEDILKLNKLREVVHQIFWSLHASWYWIHKGRRKGQKKEPLWKRRIVLGYPIIFNTPYQSCPMHACEPLLILK